MATTTTNFGWDIPQSTDLVKDGATAIAALGQDIDTALVDLKGGTTGQVLAKASGTDLDFSWVAQDDSNAIQNAIVDAKGDLISATAADTPARLAVGTNGHVLTADSTESTGLKWASSNAMTLLSTTTLSGVTTTISSISQDYKTLIIQSKRFNVATTAGNPQFLPNSSATLAYWGGAQNNNGTAGAVGESGATIRLQGNTGVGDLDNASTLIISDYANTTGYKPFTFYGYTQSGGAPTTAMFGGAIRTNSAITSLQIVLNAGTAAGGTVEIYGVK